LKLGGESLGLSVRNSKGKGVRARHEFLSLRVSTLRKRGLKFAEGVFRLNYHFGKETLLEQAGAGTWCYG